jgi:PKD repeat protein
MGTVVSLLLPVLVLCTVSVYAQTGAGQKKPTALIQQSITCCPGDSVVFNGWASTTPAGIIDIWYWDLNEDGSVDYSGDGGDCAFRAPDEPDIYTVILRIEDCTGAISAPDSALLHVMRPHCDATAGSDTTVHVGDRVYFTPRIRCRCTRPTAYAWDLNGDGVFEYQSQQRARTSRVYYSPGTYEVVLRCRGTNGYITTGMRRIRVVPKAAQRHK